MASLAEWRPQARSSKLTIARLRDRKDDSALSILRRVATRMSQTAWPEKIRDIIELVGAVVPCGSCFLYALEDNQLVLRVSKNPDTGVADRIKLTVRQGSAGSVADYRKPAAIPRRAGFDPRCKFFTRQPDDRYEAFLSVPLMGRGKLVGVIMILCRESYEFTEPEIGLISALGYLVGAEIEMARLEEQNIKLSRKLETRTLVERAKGILQADLRITEQQAYQKLQRQSQEMRRSMKEIAEAIVLSHALRSQEAARGSASSKVFGQSEVPQ